MDQSYYPLFLRKASYPPPTQYFQDAAGQAWYLTTSRSIRYAKCRNLFQPPTEFVTSSNGQRWGLHPYHGRIAIMEVSDAIHNAQMHLVACSVPSTVVPQPQAFIPPQVNVAGEQQNCSPRTATVPPPQAFTPPTFRVAHEQQNPNARTMTQPQGVGKNNDLIDQLLGETMIATNPSFSPGCSSSGSIASASLTGGNEPYNPYIPQATPPIRRQSVDQNFMEAYPALAESIEQVTTSHPTPMDTRLTIPQSTSAGLMNAQPMNIQSLNPQSMHTQSTTNQAIYVDQLSAQLNIMQSTNIQSTNTQFTNAQWMNTPSSNTPSSNIPSSNTPSSNTPSSNTPSSNTPSWSTPSWRTPSSNTPSWSTPSWRTPSSNTPSSNTPSWNTPSLNTPSMSVEPISFQPVPILHTTNVLEQVAENGNSTTESASSKKRKPSSIEPRPNVFDHFSNPSGTHESRSNFTEEEPGNRSQAKPLKIIRTWGS